MREAIIRAWATDLREVQTVLESGGYNLHRRFDMAHWTRFTVCGFAGCAIGWGFYRNVFRRYGLSARIMLDNSIYIGERRVITPNIELAGLLKIEEETLGVIVFEEYYDEKPVEPIHVAERLEYLADHGEAQFQKEFGISEDD